MPPIIAHKQIAEFADRQVNLKRDNAKKLRKQAKGLRDKLESYIKDHPDFALRRMMLSGSLAKSTSLASASDIDVALYVLNADTPDTEDLAEWLAEKLRTAYPNKDPDDIKPQNFSVCIHYRTSGLDVDVVPILYDGNEDWDGNLVNKNDGSLLKANIPRQIEFFNTRKNKLDSHDYRQVIRLLKYWSKQRKTALSQFRCKSFLIELLVAHLVDEGRLDISDYPTAMRQFFDELATGLLRSRIAFTDFYPLTDIPGLSDLVQVIDPVNSENNVTAGYGTTERDLLEREAMAAADAIVAAEDAPTKHEAVGYWRVVFGNTFSV